MIDDAEMTPVSQEYKALEEQSEEVYCPSESGWPDSDVESNKE